MNKVLLGASAGVSALLMGVGSGHVAAQQGPECAPIYDTTPHGEDSPALQQVIGEYALHGIEVHVQILEDATVFGVNTKDDAPAFADHLDQTCGWQDPDVVNVLVSVEPRAIDIARYGAARNDIPKSTADNVVASMVPDLTDRSTPFQSDVAKALVKLDPYDTAPTPTTQAPAPSPTVVSAPSNSSNQSEGSNFPTGTVIEIAVGLVAAGAAGTRIKRGLSLKADFTEGLNTAHAAEDDINKEFSASETQLSVLQDDDAEELRDASASAGNTVVKLNELRQKLEDAYKTQRSKPWPSRRKLADSVDDVAEISKKAHGISGVVAGFRQEVEDLMAHIDGKVTKFCEIIDASHAKAKELQNSGWDIGHYVDDLASFDATATEIADLRNQHYIEKPAEMIDGQDDKVLQVTAELEALPSDREAADADYAKYPTETEARQKASDAATEALKSLREQYHPSCYQDLDKDDVELGVMLSQLEELRIAAKGWIGVKIVKALEATENTNEQFEKTLRQIDRTCQDITGRISKLETIKAELPGRIDATDNELEGVHTYAFNTYHDDVEPDTRDKITALQNEFTQFKRSSDVTADKPKYLELESKVADHRQNAQALGAQARNEKQEMDELRSEVQNYERRNESDLSSLDSLVRDSDVDSSTRAVANSIQLMTANTSGDRQSLRQQLIQLKDIQGRIEQVEQEARSDIQRGEDRRRREQEERENRERQQREEEERRRQSSYSSNSSSSFDFGSSSSSDSGHSTSSW